MVSLSRGRDTQLSKAMQQSHSHERPKGKFINDSSNTESVCSVASSPVQVLASRGVIVIEVRSASCYRGLGALLTRSGGELQRKTAMSKTVENQIKVQSIQSSNPLSQVPCEHESNPTTERTAIGAQQLHLISGKQGKPTKQSKQAPLRGEKPIMDCSCLPPYLPSPLSNSLIMASTTKRADFEAIFPGLAKDILEHAKRYNLPANALEWFEKVRHYPPSYIQAP